MGNAEAREAGQPAQPPQAEASPAVWLLRVLNTLMYEPAGPITAARLGTVSPWPCVSAPGG